MKESVQDFTADGKVVKDDNTKQKPLTERQKKCGSLKDRDKYWSEKLRCWFYIKKGNDFEEIEKRYLESQLSYLQNGN